MPRYLISESAEATLSALCDALDRVDFGILLLNRDLRACFINHRFDEIWHIPPALLATGPTFRELLECVAAEGRYDLQPAGLPAYLDEREAEVRAGSTQPAVIQLADGRHILFCCIACPDGGRILTHADITRELQRTTDDPVARISAELRFNSEILEEQGAQLATLAEVAEENAQKAEQARRQLEYEVAERRQLEIKLRQLATTDGLTGLLNCAEFPASAQREFEACQLGGQRLIVLMLDVDHFKAMNDRFGHAGGDHALQQLVVKLRAGVRQVDLLGRLGGEEFAIVLCSTPPPAAEAVAERMRLRVAEMPIPFGERLISMTVSIGLAIQLETDRSIDEVIARADDALYRAKSSGRNRVIRHLQPEAA
jgi:diguanylate cyclase (GGDEF)-like protein